MGMNWEDLLAQANIFKENMLKVKQILESKTMEVKGGHGAVVVVVNGLAQIKEIRLAPDAMTLLGREGLQNTLTQTVNEALEGSKKLAAETVAQLTGINLGQMPGQMPNIF